MKIKKLKINVVDIIIILLALAIVVGVFVWRKNAAKNSVPTAGSGTVTYTIEVNYMVGDTAYLIHEGDEIVDNVKKYSIGTVTDVKVTDMLVSGRNLETGDFINTAADGYRRAEVTLTSPCTVTDANIVVGGGYNVKVGSEAFITGPGYMGSGYVIAVERGDGK